MVTKNNQPAKSLFFLLYFFEGAPMGLIWWTIPSILALEGFSVEVITTLGASATLPWTFKFLLGPVVDRYLSTVKQHAWTIATLQIGMAFGIASLLMISMSNPLVLWFVLIISFFSAAQDVVIDAWAVASIPENEKGRANGAMQAGLLSGRWFFGAGLLVAMTYISFQLALYVLLALTFFSIFFLFFKFKNQNLRIGSLDVILNLDSFKFIINPKYIFLAFIALTTGFALEGFTSVISPYLVHYGLSREGIGGVLSVTLFAMLGGSIVGGLVSDYIGILKSFVLSSLILSAIVVLMGLALVYPFVVFISLIILTYFFIGFFTTSSYAYYMKQSQGHMEASKFTFLMAITNLCEVVAAFGMGKMITQYRLTYFTSFFICALIAILGTVLLLLAQKSKMEV